MADSTFRAKIRPALTPDAAELVAIYEATPGSTSPGCCPEALAAVLDYIWNTYPCSGMTLAHLANGLEGKGE